MKVLLLGDLNSVHVIKWVLALHKKSIQIGVFSLSSMEHTHFDNLENVTVKSLAVDNRVFRTGRSSIQKLSYLKALPLLKAFIKDFAPDIVHAHYASSYGLLGALSKFKPYIISVWGSDIYDFPNVNFIFKEILKYSLKQADLILSTSHVMADETKKYTDKEIKITPFGVNLSVFKKIDVPAKASQAITIGTVKALEHIYGIDTLIETFALVNNRVQDELSLQIVGAGSLLDELKFLCKKLKIENKVHFTGKLDNTEIPQKLNEFQIYVALSRNESFGVAIVEAQACEVPVVVSDVGGLPEVVAQNKTGIIVPANDPEKAAEAILKLIQNASLREQMGKDGRERVQALYDWDKNVTTMHEIYEDLLVQG